MASHEDIINYLLEIYRNSARMLVAGDLLMEERGLSRYDWEHIYDYNPIDEIWRAKKVLILRQSETFFSSPLFHQYYETGKKGSDVVTLCAAPWRHMSSKSLPALCSITRFRATRTSNEVYLIGTTAIWDKNNAADGRLKEYDINSKLWTRYAQDYSNVVVKETSVLSISIALAEVTSSDGLRERLLEPLLSAR